MKHAYLSLVLMTSDVPSRSQLDLLQERLSARSASHEIIICTDRRPSSEALALLRARQPAMGPVSVVTTRRGADENSRVIAGLARSVGDFVLEWRGQVDDVTEELLATIEAQVRAGRELIEVVPLRRSRTTRLLYGAVNRLRSKDEVLTPTVGYLLSRHAVGRMLGATRYEPEIAVLAAEFSGGRSYVFADIGTAVRRSMAQRAVRAIRLIGKGSRLGTVLPVALAGVAAVFALSSAIYAVAILAIRGTTPEGWVTVMIAIGLGFTGAFALLGVLLARLDAIYRGLSRPHDPTVYVEVVP